MLAFLASPAARYLALIVAALGFVATVYLKGHRDGVAEVKSQIAADNARRLQDAFRADDDARRCAADPECRLRNDGFRRD